LPMPFTSPDLTAPGLMSSGGPSERSGDRHGGRSQPSLARVQMRAPPPAPASFATAAVTLTPQWGCLLGGIFGLAITAVVFAVGLLVQAWIQ
ncbi:MAG: hypothetical protein ABMA64_30675, partial [Myxococcota bacterium]